MTVASSSYEAKVSEAIVALLTTSTNFQGMVGAANATLAKNFTIEDDGGDDQDADGKFMSTGGVAIDPALNWAMIRCAAARRVERAWLTWGWEGDATIMLVMHPIGGDTAPETIRRARNYQGLIRVEMENQIGGATTFGYATFSPEEITVSDEIGANAGAILIPIKLTWRDIP
jgi:hypothetical protein